MISVWPTNASGLMVAGGALARHFYYQTFPVVITGAGINGVASLSSQSLTGFAPPKASAADIVGTQNGGGVSNGCEISVAGDSTGTSLVIQMSITNGAQTMPGGISSAQLMFMFPNIIFSTPLTVYWGRNASTGSTFNMYVSGYGF